ncbi:hypothetical protein BpHYR1_019850 [Brachionus plicatilis]|uniref:RNA-directed DNA polymerase from mobile element jockey-like n=1 Tax=Brachionus plicatilis TaxID=10195 RepID=A0A3M7QP73_BRAPC|nr:hypothetical protein BpHYR1_019850 [Brachionus plicatilis]
MSIENKIYNYLLTKLLLFLACANSLTKITDFLPILLDEYNNDLHIIKLLIRFRKINNYASLGKKKQKLQSTSKIFLVKEHSKTPFFASVFHTTKRRAITKFFFPLFLLSILRNFKDAVKNGYPLTENGLKPSWQEIERSNSRKGLQKALNSVAIFGEQFEVEFNPDKTVFIIFNQREIRTAVERMADIWQEKLSDGEKKTETLSINRINIKLIERFENNILRAIYNIPKRLHLQGSNVCKSNFLKDC